jgi:hypothetical protein
MIAVAVVVMTVAVPIVLTVRLVTIAKMQIIKNKFGYIK